MEDNLNIYLIRHGRQASKLCNVNVELAEEGIKQAELLSKRMKFYPLDGIYSSQLIRAVQTAEIINQNHQLIHEVRPELEEIDFGDLTGHTDEYIEEHYSEFFSKMNKCEEDLPYPGGESGKEVYDRAMSIINEIIESGKEEVAVVTHGGVIRALVAELMGAGLARRGRFARALENTSITNIHYNRETETFYLQSFNDVAHLEEEPTLMRRFWK